MFSAIEKRSRIRGASLLAAGMVCLMPALSLAQVPRAPILLQPTGEAPFPLSYDDPIFANNVSSGPLNLNGGTVRSNLSITQDGPQASVQGGTFTLNNSRIRSSEAIRAAGGSITLNWVWAEAKGIPGDHADVFQCYGPGSSGNHVINNTTFRAYNNDATAGYFAADNWNGTLRLNNVLFWGGPFGLRVNVDGGDGVYLNNVYFVKDSFMWSAYLIDVPILEWKNVYWATIVNGKLVVGAAIPKPN